MMNNLGLPTVVQLCKRCADRLTTARNSFSPAALLRGYSSSAAVNGDSDQVQRPLNLVAGQRVDATDSAKHFELFAPATGHFFSFFSFLFVRPVRPDRQTATPSHYTYSPVYS